MKKLTSTVSLLLCILLLSALLCACGGSAKNVPVSELSAAVGEAIGQTDALTAADANFIKGYMKTDATQFGDYAIMVNAFGTNIDEFGILKAGESLPVDEVKRIVEDYLALRLASWMDEYMPEEKPKLVNAEVKTQGDYVMYCILSDADRDAAFRAFTDGLK